MSSCAPFVEVPAIELQVASWPPAGARLPRFIGCAGDPGAALARLRVALVGAGSLGGRAADDLARLGVAELWVIDAKSFKPESLLTHNIFPGDVGQRKAESVAHRCKLLSPGSRVFLFDGPVQALPMDAFADVDLVVLASDNLICEVDVGQRCLRLHRPLVHVAVHGDSLTAVVRFFAHASAEGPCPRCLFGAGEDAALDAETEYSCQPGRLSASQNPSLPSMSVGALCAMAAALTGQQILRFALALGEAVGDTFLEYNAYTHRTVLTKLSRRSNCPCEHSSWELARPRQPLPDCTAQDLARIALGQDAAEPDEVSLTVDGYDWVSSVRCPCGRKVEIAQFVAHDCHEAGSCPGCGSTLSLASFFRRRAVTMRELGPLAQQTFRGLGVRAVRTILVRTGARQILFRRPATGMLP